MDLLDGMGRELVWGLLAFRMVSTCRPVCNPWVNRANIARLSPERARQGDVMMDFNERTESW